MRPLFAAAQIMVLIIASVITALIGAVDGAFAVIVFAASLYLATSNTALGLCCNDLAAIGGVSFVRHMGQDG